MKDQFSQVCQFKVVLIGADPPVWWLGQIQGLESANIPEMAQGEQAHPAHGELVASYHRTRRLAYVLLLPAALIGALLLVQLGVL